MLFNSFNFIVFFITIVIIYYLLPHKFRWILLLAGSFIFYMAWSPWLIILIIFSVFVNFLSAKLIYRADIKLKRTKILWTSMSINFGLLFIFKYLVFMNHSLMYMFKSFGAAYPISEFSIILPMGISFYTFQAASYTIDVYRYKIEPQENFFKFSLFITFFPQLVAGPIERADSLMPQLFSYKRFSYRNIVTGLKYMSLGFFKKIVVADRIAVAVNTIYNTPKQFEGLSFIIAAFLFAFQIYCDFSGYSDIAVGSAKILGIDLMRNFRQPYLAKSIREFWSRWHISLSSWFKEYLYIPLGGNRVSKPRYYFNTFFTFLVSGLWHGANWTYLIWGAIHGIAQVFENIFKNKPHPGFMRRLGFINWLTTFSVVLLAFIFFRANTVSDSFYIVSHLFTGADKWLNLQYIYNVLNSFGMPFLEMLISFGLILFLIITDIIGGKSDIHERLMKAPVFIRLSFYYILAVLIISLGVYYNAGEFIYFQF